MIGDAVAASLVRAPGSRFVTLEGIDGAGKSSHIAALSAALGRDGRELVVTREPGGTDLAEQLRELLLRAAMDPLSEALLVFAARHDHLSRVIRPALARGATVLCDRFSDASFAYQGGGRGCDWRVLGELESWVHGDLQPDLTIWFDLPPAVAAERRSVARPADRFEQQDLAFFDRVRTAYLRRMGEAPRRFRRIDAAASRDAVWQQIAQALAHDGD